MQKMEAFGKWGCNISNGGKVSSSVLEYWRRKCLIAWLQQAGVASLKNSPLLPGIDLGWKQLSKQNYEPELFTLTSFFSAVLRAQKVSYYLCIMQL